MFEKLSTAHFMEAGELIYDLFNRELINPNSGVNFAWRWSNLSSEQQLELLYGGREPIIEIQEVMRWTLQVQREIWMEGIAWDWSLINGPSYLRLIVSSSSIGEACEDAEADLPLVFHIARFLVEKHIGSLIAPLRRLHVCTRSYPSPDEDDQESWACIRLETPPTAHEQLEANLSLRQWLQSHASPREFAEIWQHVDE